LYLLPVMMRWSACFNPLFNKSLTTSVTIRDPWNAILVSKEREEI